MDTENLQLVEEIKMAILKAPASRSYDDLLLLKSYITKTEFITKNLAGVVNPKQMNDICRSMSLESYSIGDVVFNQGDIGDKVYVLLSGSCEVRVKYKIDLTQGQSEIREKLIVTYHSGQFFGERALQFDEPRSGTVVCTSFTDLVTITKATYVAVLNDARKEAAATPSKDQLGTKESVINILSKIREKRTNQELDAVAAYLWRRIPFFQKFTTEQLVELCRVAETVSIWGRSMLFKQGQSGQAFYVILTGTVEVWVQSDNSAASNVAKVHVKPNDLTEGLGNKVNQLVSGDVFGERALENDTSQRMASIVTCEDKTELLVIAKEDYHNLVYVMMHIDSMSRLSLLRKTELFRSVDVVHLKVLARFMEPRKYNRDEPLFIAGRKAIEMIIIEKGECRAETIIREGYEKMTEDERRAFHEHHYMQQTHHQPAHHNEYHHYEMQDFSLGDNKASKPAAAHRDHRNYHSELDIRQDSNHIPGVRKGEARLAFPSITISHGVAKSLSKSHHDEDVTTSTESAAGGIFKRPPMKRFDTVDLIPLGELKTINLGRIAPNSVLATYITQCETIHNEVFHPETVIASSLVTAYTIGKHDFFNHMPKDTRAALVKIVADFKTPMLSSLWENVPRVLDESQWKKSKTWEIYRQNIADDKKDANILQTYGNLSKMHISASSGNNSQSRINQKNEMLMHNREQSNNTSSNRAEVSLDWGLPKVDPDAVTQEVFVPVAASPSQHGHHGHSKVPFGHAPQHAPVSPASNQLNVRPMTTYHEMSLTIPENDFHVTPSPGQSTSNKSKSRNTPHSPTRNRHNSVDSSSIEPPSLITSAVSKMIRNRINYSHYTDRLQQSLSGQPTGGTLDFMSPKHNSNTNGMLSPSAAVTRSLASTHTSVTSMPFFLIQIHRESSRNAGASNMLHNNSRGVRCYLRLCGSAPSCANVKEFADIQMENIYLTMFKSDAGREKELLLRWVPFKGFDSVPVNDSDHFIIYCRSTPIEYASINPSKNLFNAPFPAMCKQKGQRYSCIVSNILVDHAALHAQRTQQQKEDASHHKHHHRHHHRHHSAHTHEDEEEDDDDSGDEGHRRHHHSSKQKHSSARKNKVSIASSISNPNMADGGGGGSPGSITTTNLSGPSLTLTPFSPAPLGAETPKMSISVLTGGNASSDVVSSGSVVTFAAKRTVSPVIPYMAEFSVLNEVLVTTSNRLDAIRYAIQRFGSFVDPSKAPPPSSHIMSPSVTSFDGGVLSPSHHVLAQQNNSSNHVVGGGMGQKIYLRRPNTSAAHLANAEASGSSFMPSPGIALIASDRVLELVNHDNKRICIVPLFKWILVNDDTLKTFDFTNAFSDEANKQQMQLDETSSVLLGDTSDGDDYSRKTRLSGKGKLLHSFAEAGLLNGDAAIAGGGEDDNDSPRSDTDDRLALKQQHIAKSLQILERDLQTKELSKKILLQQSQSAQELQPLVVASARRKTATQQPGGYSLADTLAGPGGKPSSPHMRGGGSSLSSPSPSSSSAAATVESIKLEARLKNMNDSSAARSQFITMSNKLSEEEHKLMSRSNNVKGRAVAATGGRSTPLPALDPSLSSTGEAKQLVQIAERIDLALSIRNLNFVKVPTETSTGGGAMVAADSRRISSLSTRQRSNTALGGSSGSSRDGVAQSAPVVVGSVGKRISENIRLLSESMANKL